MVTGSPGLWTVLGAVFAVDWPVGAIVERLHALHQPRLVAKLPAGFTAGTPLFHHPPVGTAGFHVTQQLHFSSPVVKIHSLCYPSKIARMTHRWTFGRCHFYDLAVISCMDGQICYYSSGSLTWVGCSLEHCSVFGSVWAFCWFRKSSDALNGCRSSSCIRIL